MIFKEKKTTKSFFSKIRFPKYHDFKKRSKFSQTLRAWPNGDFNVF